MIPNDLHNNCCTETGQIPAMTGASASSANTCAEPSADSATCQSASSCNGATDLSFVVDVIARVPASVARSPGIDVDVVRGFGADECIGCGACKGSCK